MLRIAKTRSFCSLCIAAAIWAAGPMFGSTAQAAAISNNNSDLTINTSGSNPLITSWTVDGVDQYGGSPAGSEDFQISTGGGSLVELNSLSLTSSFVSPPGVGLFSATYTGAGYTVTVKDTLTGGNNGSGASALSEVITINNVEPIPVGTVTNLDGIAISPLTFRLVQLSNLNVDATAGNDTLTLSPSQPNTANQTDPLGTVVNVSVTPTPTAFTGGTVGSQSASTGPFVGDGSFTFEWDGTIDPGNSYQMSINETVQGATSGTAAVPLPSSAKSALTMLAGLAVIGIVRRMRKAKA
ncbi:MAG: hypothetical protein ABSH08_06640 [Tepidisphaeraceae bacterium]